MLISPKLFEVSPSNLKCALSRTFRYSWDLHLRRDHPTIFCILTQNCMLDPGKPARKNFSSNFFVHHPLSSGYRSSYSVFKWNEFVRLFSFLDTLSIDIDFNVLSFWAYWSDKKQFLPQGMLEQLINCFFLALEGAF